MTPHVGYKRCICEVRSNDFIEICRDGYDVAAAPQRDPTRHNMVVHLWNPIVFL